MAYEIKSKNKNGIELYQIKCTITDTLYHKNKWITLDEAKKVLINENLWNCIDKTIDIQMSFPTGYRVNDVFTLKSKDFYNYLDKQHKLNDDGKQQFEDFIQIMNKHDIRLDINKDKITDLIADIRNKLSPFVNLAHIINNKLGSKAQEIINSEEEKCIENEIIIRKNLEEILKLID